MRSSRQLNRINLSLIFHFHSQEFRKAAIEVEYGNTKIVKNDRMTTYCIYEDENHNFSIQPNLYFITVSQFSPFGIVFIYHCFDFFSVLLVVETVIVDDMFVHIQLIWIND